ADGDPRGEPALLRSHRRVRSVDGGADRHQHLVQRPGRAHRVHAPRRVPVLHAHEHGSPRARPLSAGEETAAPVARGRRLAHPVRAGLRSSMAFEESREKLGIVGELWAFMRVRKKWWLGPIVMMLALLGLLVIFTQGSAVAPFIYTLF